MGRPRKHPKLYNFGWLLRQSVDLLRTDSQIAGLVGCTPADVTSARRAYGILAMRPQGANRFIRSPVQISHYLEREECYIAKARRLMRGELVDPACGEWCE